MEPTMTAIFRVLRRTSVRPIGFRTSRPLLSLGPASSGGVDDDLLRLIRDFDDGFAFGAGSRLARELVADLKAGVAGSAGDVDGHWGRGTGDRGRGTGDRSGVERLRRSSFILHPLTSPQFRTRSRRVKLAAVRALARMSLSALPRSPTPANHSLPCPKGAQCLIRSSKKAMKRSCSIASRAAARSRW